MQTNDDRTADLIELGTVTQDTAGGDAVLPEGFTGQIRTGLSAD